jgi:hypothetical protein
VEHLKDKLQPHYQMEKDKEIMKREIIKDEREREIKEGEKKRRESEEG